jgi:hypothetical protein
MIAGSRLAASHRANCHGVAVVGPCSGTPCLFVDLKGSDSCGLGIKDANLPDFRVWFERLGIRGLV